MKILKYRKLHEYSQTAGTAFAIFIKKAMGIRELYYKKLKSTLIEGGVYLESRD